MIELNRITARNYKLLSKKDLQDIATGGYYQEINKNGTMYVLIKLEGSSESMYFKQNSIGNWRLVGKQPENKTKQE